MGAEIVAYLGYYFGYRGIEHVEGGPDFDRPRLRAVVTAGFGGFLAHGGAALDDYAMKAGGADDREATVRVTALGGFEHGVLAIIVSAAAIVALVAGYAKPPPDFTLPWAIIPALGFAAAGLLLVTLAPSLWYSGAPWSAAVLGTATYRFISLFAPMPLSFASLPRLRELARGAGTAGHGTREREGEPALGGG